MKINSSLSILIIIIVAFFFLNSCQSKKIKGKKASIEKPTKFSALLTKKIDSLLFDKLKTEHVPGISLVIVQNGKTIYKKGYGIANLEYEIPITPSSIFHIASVSKQFTVFSFTVVNDSLVAKHSRLSDFNLNPIKDNMFRSEAWFFGRVEFIRDKKNMITGCKVSNGRVRNLYFKKIN